jgi:hypothetical protein
MFQATVENRGDSRWRATAASSEFVIGTEGHGVHPREALPAMHRAWCKATLLSVTLWARPYVADLAW